MDINRLCIYDTKFLTFQFILYHKQWKVSVSTISFNIIHNRCNGTKFYRRLHVIPPLSEIGLYDIIVLHRLIR